MLPTVVENIVWEGRFCRDKGGKKVSYPSYNLSAKKSPPTLYKEWGGEILAELKNQYKYNEYFFPVFLLRYSHYYLTIFSK